MICRGKPKAMKVCVKERGPTWPPMGFSRWDAGNVWSQFTASATEKMICQGKPNAMKVCVKERGPTWPSMGFTSPGLPWPHF